MTPNLTTLFKQATQRPWSYDRGILPPDGPGRYSTISSGDDTTIAEVNDCITAGTVNAQLIVLLATHGQALIEALEACTDGFKRPEGSSLLVRSQVYALLATLEREAGDTP